MNTEQPSVEQLPGEARRAPLYTLSENAINIGFLAALGIIVVGVALLIASGEPLTDDAEGLRDIWSGLRTFDALAIIEVGIFGLILVPPLSILCSMLLFLKERDRIFVLVALAILVVFVFSIIVALQ